ncbi:MAG: type II toxin-antitoxin system PemK/MazF family toxin [Alphaproteobacteria bacterium]|nr:type II toxin-antitoxin system PemK/MazF family toxin [Alphaproteobacteria bacterium]MDE2075206.1 type II toxin-antitoxin system PemK/MazF family toxin [Alphaproteobacteria bacterium]MDE2352664.1 type II toxin-antitoxin system PemK/MazF family toxin [Alphaproteobacteria bacterium]
MNLAPPERGSVIRYAYLWADEHRRGREEAQKDRPALVLALSVRTSDDRTEVLVLAITHTPPTRQTEAVALPPQVKRRLKLDDDASWIVTTEANAFIWPGPDIRPIPNRAHLGVVYGKIPEDLLQAVARSFLANRKRQQTKFVPRSG